MNRKIVGVRAECHFCHRKLSDFDDYPEIKKGKEKWVEDGVRYVTLVCPKCADFICAMCITVFDDIMKEEKEGGKRE